MALPRHPDRYANLRPRGLVTARWLAASREYPVEKWMRNTKLEEIEEGTSDIQRLIIARGLVRS
ncbi:MAG: hypothetical protein NVS4B3_19330 [Gemmatimonadaceae bacterium]